jgi:hypothetical protein
VQIVKEKWGNHFNLNAFVNSVDLTGFVDRQGNAVTPIQLMRNADEQFVLRLNNHLYGDRLALNITFADDASIKGYQLVLFNDPTDAGRGVSFSRLSQVQQLYIWFQSYKNPDSDLEFLLSLAD